MQNGDDALPTDGASRIFHDGEVVEAAWSRPRWVTPYERLLTLADGRTLVVSDTDERLGFVYRGPDSGTRMTSIVVILGDDETVPDGVPDAQTAIRTSYDAMRPLYESVAAGETDPDDLDFCRQIFSSPAAMLRTISRTGSLEAARRTILFELFQVETA